VRVPADLGVDEPRILLQNLVGRVAAAHPQLVLVLAAAGNRHDVDEPQPSDRVNVMGAGEAGTHNPHPDPFHQEPPGAVIGTVIIYQGGARIRASAGR
jgi:hypothetical protein